MKVTPNQEMNELLNAGSVFNIVVESGSVVAVGTLNNEIIFNETISTSRAIGNYEHDVQFKIFSVGGIAEVTETLDVTPSNQIVNSDIYKRNTAQAKTASGSYTGNGTAQTITLGFRPDFVIIKSGAGQQCVFAGNGSFLKRTNFFLNIASIRGDFGIVITEDGFSVGNDQTVNLLGGGSLTYYYFAYCDNGSNSLLQAGFAGNAITGRTVDNFSGTSLSGAWIKRDSARSVVFCLADATQNLFYDGTNNAVSTGTTLNGSTGVLTVGNGPEINQWNGLLGEGMYYIGFPRDSDATYVTKYIGTGATQDLILPWEPECLIFIPRGTGSAASRMWLSSFPANNAASLSGTGIGTGDVTVTRGGINRNLVTLASGSGMNTVGVEYALYAFKKNRHAPYFPLNNESTVHNKTVVVNSTGYIDCGTSDTLAISNDITMEWYGVITNIDATQYVAGGDADNDAGNQDKIVPLIFRSGGADRLAGAVSYGMAVTAGPVTVDQWIEPNLLVCNHDKWQIVNATTGIELRDYPTNTGVTVELGKLVHILVTHKSQGEWNVYVNGFSARETKFDRIASIGRPNVQGYAGHRTMLLARQRDAISNTNGGAVKLARLYNKALTKEEAFNNYLAIFGKATATPGFVEEWNANNASGTTLRATVNSENNGTITNGLVI